MSRVSSGLLAGGLTWVVLAMLACGGPGRSRQVDDQQGNRVASPGHPADSSSGLYRMTVVDGRPQNGVRTLHLHILDNAGKVVYDDNQDYAIGHRLTFVWSDTVDEAWILSSDVGISYVEHDTSSGAWVRHESYRDARRTDVPKPVLDYITTVIEH
jgi:hypothetical protein